MHHFPLTFSLLLIITFFRQLESVKICSSFSCNRHVSNPIQFPFRVTGNQTTRCGYPGFELSCNSNTQQTLLSLPSTNSPEQSFVVEGISYPDQQIWLSDPNHCVPKRVMDLSLSNTPYSFGPEDGPYALLNCSSHSGVTKRNLPMGSSVISCMGEGNYTVVAAFEESAERALTGGNKKKSKGGCELIMRLNAAFWWREMDYGYYPLDMSDVFLQLSWDNPSCGVCALRGGECHFVEDSGLEVACFLPPAGFPRSAKYGLILGAGLPILLCIVGLTFYISRRVNARNRNRRVSNTESAPSTFSPPIIITTGLDNPTIESYPKTVLGASKRLPEPTDNICPICLSEYESKETLRFIPECNHYFHADCIDEWLRMHATCPICRNSPQRSDALPPC